MSEIKINVNLDLETEKAKEQLENFKKSAKDEKIPIRLDIDKAKQDTNNLKNILSNAFNLDSNTVGNLKQVESTLKQINKLIKSQSELSKKNNSNNDELNVGINKSSLEDMEKFINLSKIVDKTMFNTNKSSGYSNEVKEYLKVTKELNNLYADLYKSETNGTNDISSEIREKIDILRKLQLENASAIRSNSELYASMREKIDAEEKLYQATQNIKNARTDEADRVKALKQEEKELKGLVSAYDKYEKELTDLKQTQSSLFNDGKENSANSLNARIEEIEKLKKELKETNEIKFGDNLITELNNIEKKYKEIAIASEKLSKAKQNDANTAALNKTYQELDKIQDKLTSMQKTKGFLDNDLVEKTNSLLAETRSKLDANGIESDFKEISNSVDILNNNLKELNTGNTLGKQEANFNVSLQNMENKVNAFIDKCKEMGNADHLIERVEYAFRSINTENIERATVDLRQMTNVMNQAEREARQLSSTMNSTRTFFGNFGQEFRDNLFTFTAGELLADGIRNVAHSLKDLVMEYDKSITNLKKVANPEDIMDVSQLEAIEKKAVSIAKNVGQSSQDTIQAIADTIQMSGLSMEASTMVAEQTMMLANVAEMTQEAASKGVVTMLSAFKLDPLKEVPLVVDGATKSVNQMVDAMDKINYVGNKFAISSDGILDAITSGANVLATYGGSMNDTIAMITAANTTLQDTSRVGNGLKTIQTKLAGIKTSAKDGTMSLNKTAMALKEIAGINVFSNESKGELKDMATIIAELGAKWEGFTEKQKAGLSEAIAGANQMSVFKSLMENIKVMEDVQSKLANGDHFQSMAKENEQYVDSIAGKLNKLKETWVGIFNTLFDSNAAKGIIDGLIKISEAISKVIETLDSVGMLTPVLVGLGTVLAGKAFSGIGSIFSGGARGIQEFAHYTGVLPRIIPRAAEGLGKFGLTGTRAGVALLTAGESIGGFLGTAASFVPWAVAAGVAISAVAAGVDYFTESLDEEEKRLNGTISARKEEISSLEEQKGKLQEIQKEYDTLANKPKKTSQEVEKLNALTKELAQIKPELVVGEDENGNPILSMTGDVQDLIKEIDKAIEGKEKLLSVEKQDKAKNAVQQLHGKDSKVGSMYGNMFGNNSDLEMNKLEKITSDHVDNMSKLEAKRDKILNQLYEATGQERQKLLKDLDKANYEIQKAQDDYVNSYGEQLNVIKGYSDEIGDGLFSSIEVSSSFKNATEELQKNFSSLREHLDFSDVRSDQLLDAEYALSKLFEAAKNGNVNLEELKASIEKANNEFAKTGDSEKYAKNIDNIIETLKEIPGLEHVDFDILKNMFEGIDTSVTKGKDSLDEFLRAYNKTAADIEKGDAFAKALAEQKRHIEEALGNLEITDDANVNLEIAYDLVSNSNLPEQLRDMVRTLINKNHDPTEVLKVAQQVMIDLQDGKIDIEQLQSLLDEKFGEGAFEITPEILLNENSKVAGVERVIQQINDKFGEIPPVVKTIIEAEGITAFSEARRLTEIYLAIPEEVRTNMTNNGLESASDVLFINQLLNNLPTSVVTNIVNNFPEVFEDADSIEDVINNLPNSVLIEIQNNYPEVVEKSKLLKEAIENIPATAESKISITEEIKKDPMSLLDRVFGKNKTDMTATAVITSQVNGFDSFKDFYSMWTSMTGRGNGASGASGASANGRSIDPYGIATVDEIPSLARAKSSSGTSGGSGGTGFNATVNVTVNGLDDIRQLQDVMNNLVVKDVNATISISTAVAAKNLSGLIARINQTRGALNSLSSKNVVVNTSLSAKNLSGLIVRVNQYKTAIDSSTSRTVDIHTVNICCVYREIYIGHRFNCR